MNRELSPNTALSRYRVVSKLGAGGMGEVWLAEDTRLNRKVALKLLPAEFTQDVERVRRFRQETKAASALNHPNIITVYDIDDSDVGHFMVMELVTGRTLRAVIAEDNSAETLLTLGGQMAKALSAAHAAGITHRDIKPDNVMLRDDGYVKILDFGLALLRSTLEGDTGAFTLAQQTTPGSLVGTVAYMSPEQARGESASPPSDIFALGIVLYELATGQHPFKAETTVGYLHGITLKTPRSPASLNSAIPARLEALILSMLDKEASRRPTANEVARALHEIERYADGTISPNASFAASPQRSSVGRELERNELREAFNSAKTGQFALLCVVGEPGIGKTTLVEDFLAELAAEDQSTIMRGRCSERLAGTEAYLPFLEALESLFHSNSQLDAAQMMKQIAPTWYAQLVTLSGEKEESRRLLDEVKAASQERMKRELGSFLQAVAQVKPLVIFFDDLHWADVSTIDLLSFLAGKLDPLKALVVVTYRRSDMLLAKHPFLQIKPNLQARGLCHELYLEFLTASDIERYLELEFPGNRFPTEFPQLIHVKTEGSPLYMADLVRYLRHHRVIAQTSGVWMLAQDLPDIERQVPESVRGMIERKIAQLSEGDRELLTAASVQGYEFDSAVLAEVLGLGADDVEERLDRLERVFAFVKLTSESEFPNGVLTVRYRFVHVLYQNALYGSLRATRRASLNAMVARTLLGFYGEQKKSIASQLAALYSAARDFVPAIECYLLAVQQAAGVFADAEAAALSRCGLEVIAKLPDTNDRAKQELSLQTTLGAALMVTKGYGAPEVLKPHLRMRELCQQLGDTPKLIGTQHRLSVAYLARAEYAKAREVAEDSLRLAESLADTPMRIRSHFSLGLIEEYSGEFILARRRFEICLALYDHSRHREISLFGATLSRSNLSRVLTWTGYYDTGRQLLRETLERAEEIGHPIGIIDTLSSASFYEVLHGQMADAQAIARRLITRAEEHNSPFYRAFGLIRCGFAMTMQGGHDEGIRMMREGLSALETGETRQLRSANLTLLAEALGAVGQLEEALVTLEDVADTILRSGERYFEAEMHRIKGELLLRTSGTDREANAENCYQRAIAIAREQSAKSWELRATTSLARLWQRQGKREEAQQLLAKIYEWFTEGFDTTDLKNARTLLDELG